MFFNCCLFLFIYLCAYGQYSYKSDIHRQLCHVNNNLEKMIEAKLNKHDYYLKNYSDSQSKLLLTNKKDINIFLNNLTK